MHLASILPTYVVGNLFARTKSLELWMRGLWRQSFPPACLRAQYTYLSHFDGEVNKPTFIPNVWLFSSPKMYTPIHTYVPCIHTYIHIWVYTRILAHTCNIAVLLLVLHSIIVLQGLPGKCARKLTVLLSWWKVAQVILVSVFCWSHAWYIVHIMHVASYGFPIGCCWRNQLGIHQCA